ncbi:MAG: hypothetical protein JOZ27_01150 [Caulobacteraceae bacterium]|nr:hypothetical protein [Caulobacteraceae bacterium]
MTRALAVAVFTAPWLVACALEQPIGFSPAGPAAPSADAYEPGPPATFDAREFAWSLRPGGGAIFGAFGFRVSGQRYSCEGSDVILTPETPWSRRRMMILYGSASGAAAPVSIVKARTAGAPSGDFARFVRKTTCDEAGHFAFQGLPDGAWYVITVGKPVDGQGEAFAVTRRVETRGGPRNLLLN